MAGRFAAGLYRTAQASDPSKSETPEPPDWLGDVEGIYRLHVEPVGCECKILMEVDLSIVHKPFQRDCAYSSFPPEQLFWIRCDTESF